MTFNEAGSRLLPGDLASLLNPETECRTELLKDFGFAIGQIRRFERISLQVVELEWLEWAVLDQLPVTTDQSFDGFSAVSRTTFSADEIQITDWIGLRFT